MKKFSDRHNPSKIYKKLIPLIAIALVVGLLVVGFKSGVLMQSVVPALTKAVLAVPPRLWIGLLFKLLVLSGLMGFITRKLTERRERFLNGENEYRLVRNYTLIVGYDFQSRPLIKKLLRLEKVEEESKSIGLFGRWMRALKHWIVADDRYKVLVITSRDVRTIRAEMATELGNEERKRVLYMRRELGVESSYSSLRIRGANAINLMGDEGMPERDGIVLQASNVIAEKVQADIRAEKEAAEKTSKSTALSLKEKTFAPIKVYLQFDDPVFYSQMRDSQLPMDPKVDDKSNIVPDSVLFDLDVFNYCDSWVWKCWSEKDSTDHGEPYLPLRFKPDAERVELFVVGSGKAAKSVVDSAITLMNYGYDTKRCRMSVVSDRSSEILPPEDVIVELPELEVADYSMRELNRGVSAKMAEAASDEKCAVTIVIVEDDPAKVLKTYLGLPFALRSKQVSVLLWMGCQSRNIPQKRLIRVKGEQTLLRYFGMSDSMPWLEHERYAGVVDVNYYWAICNDLPILVSEDRRIVDGKLTSFAYKQLIPAASAVWNGARANDFWMRTERWAKWANINSVASFKEKSALIGGRELSCELLARLLKAEHNRWWAERLLAGWRYAEARDNVRRHHPDMKAFESLKPHVQDLDKICIAAMARQGFIA